MPQIPSKMKALLIEEVNKPYTLRTDVAVPKVKPGMILVCSKAAGFCHTDVMALAGHTNPPLPTVPGHENVGVVAALGEGVTGFNIGDRVGAYLYRNPCHECRECKNKTYNYCDKVTLAGLNGDGGMAEYFLADALWTVHLPDALAFEKAAPLMCAGGTVYQSILNAKLDKGKIMAIVGIGGLGHLGVQFAKVMGYRVVAVDTRSAPLDLVSHLPPRLAPDLVINPTDGVDKTLERIAATFDGATGVDCTVVCTDALPAFQFSMDIMAKHSVLVFVGLPLEPVPFHFSFFLNKDAIVVAGALGPKESLQEMLELAVKEDIHVEIKEYTMENANQMLKDYENEGMKGKFVVRIDRKSVV